MPKFITFEGIEGCGKTTQLKLLANHLREKGYSVYETREPGGTLIGDQIRKILLNPENKNICSIAELFLYEACRAQLIKELRVESRESGVRGNDKEFILCDRFIDSTIAYQGYGRGIDTEIIEGLNMIASNDIKPDITILLDMDVKTGLARARGRNINVNVLQSNLSESRFEEETLDFHEKVREGFLKIASEEPDRVKVVDATKGIEKIQKEIIRIVEMEQKKIAV